MCVYRTLSGFLAVCTCVLVPAHSIFPERCRVLLIKEVVTTYTRSHFILISI